MADANDTRRRREVVQGLRDLADWLEATPDAPVPTPAAGVHLDRVAFDALPALGLGPIEPGQYMSRSRDFGPVRYWVQARCEPRQGRGGEGGMIHQLSPEQVDSLTAEHAPQIALSVAVANEHAARTPFASIVGAVEHDLHDALENIRIAEGGEAYRGRGAHSELERVVAMNALPTDTVENGRTYEIFERHKPRGSSPTERVDVRDVETGAVHLRVLADRFVDADLAADRSAGEGRA